MSIHIRRSFIQFLRLNSSSVCKPHPSISSHFSTSSVAQAPINPFSPDSLIQKYHFHPETDSKVVSILANLKNPQKSDAILSFLKQSGFSPAHLENILKCWPKLLSVNLDKILKPKIKIFLDFGFSNSEIVGIISKDPAILHSSASRRVVPSLHALKGLLKSTEKVVEISKVSGWYLRSDLTSSLLPNINLLTSCGVAMDKILWLMHYFPRFMLQSTDCLRKYVDKADRMGADRASRMYVHSVRVIGSMRDETWDLKVRTLRDLGFSETDVRRVFRMQPQVFSISAEKIRRVKEVIVASGKYDVSCIFMNPASLSRSIERRYRPRFEVLRILEAKNLIRYWPSFSTLHKMTGRKFFERYVSPFYDVVGAVYEETRRVGKI